ncbi:hypothetical protein B5F07_03270 [Lachnoclostridium sp. An169]|uniref:hypothetical protein n=1 Tax=Lachnoclostridium sp. An169 TaxID=1965569 RepID=UPI000B39873B|nr:hypothetical protein [Lachnoclostridium sp. An169]OUP85704.1 hypothetical protein B5F07_03270 [Lachnoclostridium sp. An169]HJA67279.1 hypothetical protein [Candidatus Mediterraneibacter cottocaccae]
MPKAKMGIKTQELVIMGILTAVLFMGQVLLAFLPNVEIVTLLILLYTLIFGRKVFFIIYSFVLLEGIFYGFRLWWINSLYVWSILAVVVLIFRRQRSPVFWSLTAGYLLRPSWSYRREYTGCRPDISGLSYR